MNKFDLRFQKTEELIINAFLKVAAGSSFEQIRIKDICAVAMISRNAFYAHYADKYELLESICESLKEKMILGLTPVTSACADSCRTSLSPAPWKPSMKTRRRFSGILCLTWAP